MKKVSLSKLAKKSDRLAALFIDGSIQIPLTVLLFWEDLFKSLERPILVTALISIYTLVMIVIQAIKLTRYGQTIGKQFFKIKIVRMKDGKNGGFVTNCVWRIFVFDIIKIIPVLGGFVILIDDLFIFRNDRRCVHDFIAGTIVVKA